MTDETMEPEYKYEGPDACVFCAGTGKLIKKDAPITSFGTATSVTFDPELIKNFTMICGT